MDALSTSCKAGSSTCWPGCRLPLILLSKMSLGDMIRRLGRAVINMALSILAEGLRGLGRVMVLAKVFRGRIFGGR